MGINKLNSHFQRYIGTSSSRQLALHLSAKLRLVVLLLILSSVHAYGQTNESRVLLTIGGGLNFASSSSLKGSIIDVLERADTTKYLRSYPVDSGDLSHGFDFRLQYELNELWSAYVGCSYYSWSHFKESPTPGPHSVLNQYFLSLRSTNFECGAVAYVWHPTSWMKASLDAGFSFGIVQITSDHFPPYHYQPPGSDRLEYSFYTRSYRVGIRLQSGIEFSSPQSRYLLQLKGGFILNNSFPASYAEPTMLREDEKVGFRGGINDGKNPTDPTDVRRIIGAWTLRVMFGIRL